MNRQIEQPDLPRDMGDGLVLRRATESDAEAVAIFNSRIHVDAGQDENKYIEKWVLELMSGEHPTVGARDFTVVEDTATGEIVSSLNLISQRWSYEGIGFGVGRPELVGTLAAYRNRGLVRAQMDVVHAWSAGRGEMVQAITGIPWYYRQFGYDMALDLDGGRAAFPATIPALSQGQEEPFAIRQASEADLPFIQELDRAAARRYLVTATRDETLWRYELLGRQPGSVPYREFRIVESLEGEQLGLLVHHNNLWGPTLGVSYFELCNGVSWLAVAPTVLRYLQTVGQSYADSQGGQPFGMVYFWLGTEHPFYHAANDRLPQSRSPYAFFVRVPNLPAFIEHISPVLEQRLNRSVAAGHTGDLRLSFYRDGLRLRLDRGRLVEVERYRPAPGGEPDHAGFPDLSFLQLLFGYRSLAELRAFYADCWADGDAPVLLDALFPKKPSLVWAIS